MQAWKCHLDLWHERVGVYATSLRYLVDILMHIYPAVDESEFCNHTIKLRNEFLIKHPVLESLHVEKVTP